MAVGRHLRILYIAAQQFVHKESAKGGTHPFPSVNPAVNDDRLAVFENPTRSGLVNDISVDVAPVVRGAKRTKRSLHQLVFASEPVSLQHQLEALLILPIVHARVRKRNNSQRNYFILEIFS